MQALVLREMKSPLKLENRSPLVAGAGQAVVRLSAAALNRRDYWITQDKYPGVKTPIVLGSDGVGVVSSVGLRVENVWGDQAVILNPGWHWGNREEAQNDDFQILGLPADGTFAEEIVVPAEAVFLAPKHLDENQAAALPLACLTAYRALFTRAKIVSGQNVLVTGVGGGVATYLVQLAYLHGCNVFVTSSSDAKIEQAKQWGAADGFNYTDPEWPKKMITAVGPMDVDVVVDGTAGSQYKNLIEVVKSGGTIVNYGATGGAPEKLDVSRVYWKQLNLLGSTMGSPEDFQSMLDFVTEKQLVPVIDSVIPLADGNQAFEKMAASNQQGKLVLKIG